MGYRNLLLLLEAAIAASAFGHSQHCEEKRTLVFTQQIQSKGSFDCKLMHLVRKFLLYYITIFEAT
jgi:hypothetical protein